MVDGVSQGYADWRKNKIDGKDCVEMEGRTWWWVEEFVDKGGKFNGLYMTHKSGAPHQEWLRKKKYWADKKKGRTNTDENSATQNGGGNSDPKLVPSDKLKQALMTSHGMLEMQADAFLASLN